ncbi:hypothetical protein ACFSL6_08960 [Paenibacillus thailandensis]|uniref:Uncharacterized protein n=1 Tax=Paenibacillus thailandensis TaxID=393250 RepID=A0ABW5QSN6_9BACL
MALTIEELQILISAETASLKRELAAVKKQLSSMDDGLKQSTRNINKELNNVKRDVASFGVELKNTASTLKNAFMGLVGAIGTLGLNAALQDAIKYESAIGTLNLQLGEAADSFFAWGDANREALGMSRLVFAQFAAQYATMERNFASSKAQLATFTQDLLKASTIIQSRTGRSLADVNERILSGLRGETDAIEDLGIQISVSMIESTKAFRDFANGRSWDQIDFKTQGLIRHFAILEQASALYGTQLVDNTAVRQARFIAQLENMRLSLGQVFQPIYNAVLPALTAFSQAIADALGWLANLSQALFGTSFEATAQAATQASNAVSSIGSGATNAAKETADAAKAMTGALAGFDEINSISKATGATAGGTAGGVGAGLVTDVNKALKETDDGTQGISEKFQKMAEEIKSFLDRIFPQEARDRIKNGIEKVREAFDNLLDSIKEVADNPAIERLLEFFSWKHTGTITGVAYAAAGALNVLAGVIKGFDGITSGNFEQFFEGGETAISGFYDIINGVVYLINSDWGDAMANFKGRLSEAWQQIKADITAYGDPTKLEFTDFVYFIRDKAAETWGDVMEATGNWWGDIRSRLQEIWGNIRDDAATRWTEIGITLQVAWEMFLTFIQWDRMTERASQVWQEIRTGAATGWSQIQTTVSEWWNGLQTHVTWDNVVTRVSTVWGNIRTGATEAWGNIQSDISGLWNNIVSVVTDEHRFDDFITYIRTTFTTAWRTSWEGVGDTLGEVWDGFIDVIRRPVNRVIDLINEFLDSLDRLSVDVPAIPGITDGFSFGFDVPNIPKLANGGITDVNSPFLAMIGDNKTQREVVAPLGDLQNMITSAVGTAMLSVMQLTGGNSNTNQPTEAIFNIDGTTFARAFLPSLVREMNRQGMRIITS